MSLIHKILQETAQKKPGTEVREVSVPPVLLRKPASRRHLALGVGGALLTSTLIWSWLAPASLAGLLQPVDALVLNIRTQAPGAEAPASPPTRDAALARIQAIAPAAGQAVAEEQPVKPAAQWVAPVEEEISLAAPEPPQQHRPQTVVLPRPKPVPAAPAPSSIARVEAITPAVTQVQEKVQIRQKPEIQEQLTEAAPVITEKNPLPAISVRTLAGASDRDLGTLLHSGATLLRAGRTQEASAQFQQVLDQDPKNIRALVNLGVAALKDQRDCQARDFFEQAVAIAPNSKEALVNLAYLANLEGELQELEEYAKRVLAIDPGHAAILVTYCHLLESQDRLAEAVALYSRALSTDKVREDATLNAAIRKRVRAITALAKK